MRGTNEFNIESVVEYHLEDEFKSINPKLLMDFLPDIYNSQLPVLSAWKKHFIKNRVPYAITKTVDTYQENGRTRRVDRFILWKQFRI
jgi:hypothetical protein